MTPELNDSLYLLDRLIASPSVSRSESGTADIIQEFLDDYGVSTQRLYNNVWTFAAPYNPALPTVLLNSHHDTVKPSPSYTFDPFVPQHIDGKVYGLGSNDAGASVVSLATVFCRLKDEAMPFNLLLALTAEEEVSGEHGMRAFLPEIKRQGVTLDMGIIGEPTRMQPAVAERGLVVLDCTAHGITGHAARNEGVNAIYKALDDINILKQLRFDRVSPTLGEIKITVTQIEGGTQHNVVPDVCRFVVDMRTTDAYTNEQTVELVRQAVSCDVMPRSTRIQASVIDPSHPLVRASVAIGGEPYVSPTTSDMALMREFPTLKIGPGDSARSHTANEYVLESEVACGIEGYEKILRYLISECAI